MRWKNKPQPEWYRSFAWLPVLVADEWVWLEWFEWRAVNVNYAGWDEERRIPGSLNSSIHPK